MGLPSFALTFAPRRGAARLPAKPKRRGRPRKARATPSLLLGRSRGAPRKHHVDDAWLIGLVDGWKKGRGPLANTQAIAELLFEGAPPEVRRRMDSCRARYYDQAETKHAQQDALRKAVVEIEGPRFDWWVKRYDDAIHRPTRNERRRTAIKPPK